MWEQDGKLYNHNILDFMIVTITTAISFMDDVRCQLT